MKRPVKPIWATIVENIRSSEKVIVTSHHSPDGDAIGSMAALWEILSHYDKEPVMFLPEPVPRSFQFIDPDRRIQVFDPVKDKACILGSDLWFCLDINMPSRMGAIGKLVSEYHGDIICIDHHRSPEPFGKIMLTDASASATGLLLAEWAEWQDGPWTERLITALYSAIVNDTGGFRYSNTDSRTLNMAARLVERGAEPSKICQNIYGNWPEGRLRLLTRVLNSVEIDREISTAFSTVRIPDFETTKTVPADLEEFVNYGRMLEGIEISVLFVEQGDGSKCKASLRSNGLADVEEIARSLGGGGHRGASGVKFDVKLEEARKILRETIRKYMEKLVK